MKDKKSANREKAIQFAQQLRVHSGLSWQALEREVGISSDKPGETLRRWSKGRAARVTMRYIQGRAKLAHEKGLLPPLHEGLMRRKDVFGASDMTHDADHAWLEEDKKMREVEKAHASATQGLEALAQSLSKDELMVAVDTDGNEIHAKELQEMIDKLRSISLHKIGH